MWWKHSFTRPDPEIAGNALETLRLGLPEVAENLKVTVDDGSW
jgi:hypothetical protein